MWESCRLAQNWGTANFYSFFDFLKIFVPVECKKIFFSFSHYKHPKGLRNQFWSREHYYFVLETSLKLPSQKEAMFRNGFQKVPYRCAYETTFEIQMEKH